MNLYLHFSVLQIARRLFIDFETQS